MSELTLEIIDASLRELDVNANCDTAARTLYASILIGAGDEVKISALGIDAKDLHTVGDRYRRNGVWDIDGIDFDVNDQDSGMTFWMLVAVGQGLMERAMDHNTGEWGYSLTLAGKKRAEKMIRKN